MKTTRFEFSLLHQNQANKEVIVNENMNLLDHLMYMSAKSHQISDKPKSQNYGDVYIIPKLSTGWDGFDNHIAIYLDEWVYIKPKNGMMCWIEDDKRLMLYNGTDWISLFNTASHFK